MTSRVQTITESSIIAKPNGLPVKIKPFGTAMRFDKSRVISSRKAKVWLICQRFRLLCGAINPLKLAGMTYWHASVLGYRISMNLLFTLEELQVGIKECLPKVNTAEVQAVGQLYSESSTVMVKFRQKLSLRLVGKHSRISLRDESRWNQLFIQMGSVDTPDWLI